MLAEGGGLYIVEIKRCLVPSNILTATASI